MNYPISGNVSLGNVSGNIKLYINDAGTSNLTGIGYNNNSLTFGVNQSVTATPEMVINPSGNVGIGTTNPAYPLDITGNIRIGAGTTGNILFGSSGSGTTQAGYIDLINNSITIMNHQPGNLILGTNNSEDMRILSNGLVGIGTVNPQGTLHIASSGLNSTTVMIKDISNNNLLRLVGNLSTGGYNNISQNNDVGIFYGDSNNPNPRSLVIAPHAIGPSGIRMDTNGNVGIGTQTPRFRLDVNGNVGLNAINLQTVTTQESTQLGYRISNKLTGSISTVNTWIEPTGNTGRITLASQGVYLLNYSFTSRTTTAVVLMGALTLSNTLNSVYTSPVENNVPSSVFAFCGQTNVNANYNTCANSYVYVNTSTNVTIYLWWAASVVNQPIQVEGSYFQAVRIA